MNGTSGFQGVRSATSRSPANRFLHEQRQQFRTGAWNVLHTLHTPMSPREEVAHMAPQLRVKNSFLHPFFFIFTASHTNVSTSPEKAPESIAIRCVWERFSYVLICLILQLVIASGVWANDIWFIYAEGDVASKAYAPDPAPVQIDRFQYVGYVYFDTNAPIRLQTVTMNVQEIYTQVFEKKPSSLPKEKPIELFPGKPIVTRKDETHVALYSTKQPMNFVCTKKEEAFTQTDAPMAPTTGFEVKKQQPKTANKPDELAVRAFLCDLESKDKGNTKITFTIEQKLDAGVPAGTPKDVVLSESVRVHELYRFRITSGPVFSSLISKNKSYSVITNPSGQQQISSSKSNDGPVNYPVFLKCYCFSENGRDMLVDPQSWYSLERFSPIVGINLVNNPLENFYAGLSWEPVLGVDIVAGAHFAKITQLAGGFTDGQVVAAGTQPPTTNKFLTGGFVGVTADVGVIGSWLGSQITKTIKDGFR